MKYFLVFWSEDATTRVIEQVREIPSCAKENDSVEIPYRGSDELHQARIIKISGEFSTLVKEEFKRVMKI